MSRCSICELFSTRSTTRLFISVPTRNEQRTYPKNDLLPGAFGGAPPVPRSMAPLPVPRPSVAFVVDRLCVDVIFLLLGAVGQLPQSVLDDALLGAGAGLVQELTESVAERDALGSHRLELHVRPPLRW